MDSKIKYAYLKDEFGNPIVTIAYQTNDRTATYAVTVKNKHDNFSRPLGRQIATGRLTKAPVTVSVLPSEEKIRNYEVIRAIVSDLLYSSKYSNSATPGAGRVRTACRQWLDKST